MTRVQTGWIGSIDSALAAMALAFFAIGLFCGIAFLMHGLAGSIAVHFVVNLCAMLMQRDRIHKDASLGIACASAVITLIVLLLTLWFTRIRHPLSRCTTAVLRRLREPYVGSGLQTTGSTN